jgi:DNA-binding response OmpR family regulator
MHALIIEDEPVIAMAIEDALRDCGYLTFDFAESTSTAIEAAQLHCPDLVTSDVELSPGCGIDAVAAICLNKVVPVIFITGTAKLVEQRLGDHVVVHKPFVSRHISHAVQLAVAGSLN